ncbi:DeoR/GlpR family DNA-binding transcription regulator [Paenibacillus sp. J5C_2022]|uniref:DeoR/GlpR family DNA-binding transcription regulator n=1 Tax=Paenibacillus sp. J5C2022 TaxID=2977129 RepID=UPI0021D2AF5C|nr:DeoR/GlpR family DNA-binding transcription regulator [Paenibacillus sp. J5C2022]MCU6708658.1 DeoR/GlpR family DNA-binding transcription regulator [Paenibacillus sp. J5C2022]
MSLIGEERKRIILDMLNLEGKVRSADLAVKLQVSGEMIRRYLEDLEAEKKLRRIYGGAVKMELTREEPPYLKREVVRVEEKKRIGRAAAELVEDNDVIFIDDGTTTMQIIHFLQNKQNITIVLFSFHVLHLLMDYQNEGLFTGQIYFLGGRVMSKYSRVTGGMAESMAGNFRVDKAFISVDGLMMDSGITGFDLERGYLIRKISDLAQLTVAMTDHTKFGGVHPYQIIEMKDIDVIVTDVAAPSQWMAALKKSSVSWIHAE